MMTKILIIEDEASIAEVEKDYFELHGFAADICLTGTEGLRAAMNGEYELIVLDLQLPGMDGYELCRQIRAVKEVPILIVSAKKEEIDKIRGLSLGADDYITKPFSPSELVARAKAHLQRYQRLMGKREAKASDKIRIRGLVIDSSSRRVYVNDQEVQFTTKEFDLLTFLALNPNHVFSKQELFEQLWGMDSLGEIATVTVHIRRLREKIEADPSNPQYIETIWGAGYRLTV
ncbi:response regulator transcription factor [Bacillus sp. FJAT-26390]|uniref:response regulator transcription factor n=1 Tax=Bacillus sp. FJAT-26390 TaxID=1743142 RepID=UPI000807A63E|nr:response regulator transcription factor [Bacillus sp. FJAT-26390]OBZ16030.1 DNA-binding response regulator [Bacillus sp. FJAT-26390]